MESNSNLIDTASVIAEAMEVLACENDRDELIFRNWIYRAVRELGSNRLTVKKVYIPVEDLSIQKPCDYMSLVDLDLYDHTDALVKYNMHSAKQHDANDNYQTNLIKVSESDYCFDLSSLATDVCKAEMSYCALGIDDNGELILRENEVPALLAYIEYNYYKRARNSGRNGREYPHSEVQAALNRWEGLRDYTKAAAKIPTSVEAERIGRLWNTRVVNHQRKRRNRL